MFELLKPTLNVDTEKKRKEMLRENIFDSIIARRLLESSVEGMEDVGYEKEDIIAVENTLASLSGDELKCFFSVPFAIRENFFSSIRKAVLSGKSSFRKELTDRISKMMISGYTLGYHVSKFEILPKTANGLKVWDIIGYERDERDETDVDDKRLMAYYSLDYKNFYRKKGGNFLYIVRAQTGEGTPHKRDQSNNWGRAPILSVIGGLKISDIDGEVERILKNSSEK